MNAAASSRWRTDDRTSDVYDLIPFSLGGAMIGCFAVAAAFVIDSVWVAALLHFSGAGEAGDNSLSAQWMVVLTAAVAVVVSIFVGRWLFGLRRWIGLKADPLDHDTISRKRRHFTVGSMLAYAVLTPWVWVVMAAVVNST